MAASEPEAMWVDLSQAPPCSTGVMVAQSLRLSLRALRRKTKPFDGDGEAHPAMMAMLK